MPQDPRHYSPTTQEANRAREQGLGVGQRDLDTQRDPSREETATAPDRLEPFDTGFQAAEEERSFDPGPDTAFVGTPPNVDPHDIGEPDNPELEWGEPAAGALHSTTHTRRPIKTEAERGQGPKTRSRNKQIVSGKPYG
jgi:hypothetical protein